jgi:hypothetical protein
MKTNFFNINLILQYLWAQFLTYFHTSLMALSRIPEPKYQSEL